MTKHKGPYGEYLLISKKEVQKSGDPKAYLDKEKQLMLNQAMRGIAAALIEDDRDEYEFTFTTEVKIIEKGGGKGYIKLLSRWDVYIEEPEDREDDLP